MNYRKVLNTDYIRPEQIFISYKGMKISVQTLRDITSPEDSEEVILEKIKKHLGGINE